MVYFPSSWFRRHLISLYLLLRNSCSSSTSASASSLPNKITTTHPASISTLQLAVRLSTKNVKYLTTFLCLVALTMVFSTAFLLATTSPSTTARSFSELYTAASRSTLLWLSYICGSSYYDHPEMTDAPPSDSRFASPKQALSKTELLQIISQRRQHSLDDSFWLAAIASNSEVLPEMPSLYPIRPAPHYPSPASRSMETKNRTIAVASSKHSTTKIILLWTKLFGQNDWGLGQDQLGRQLDKKLCPINNCLITNDRHYLSRADAVLVHFRDDFLFDDRGPSHFRRPSNQHWVFVLWESPDHTLHWQWRLNRKAPRYLAKFRSFFNWTMTYRLDSDVPFHYGGFTAKKSALAFGHPIKNSQSRSRMAVAMLSNCDTSSHREAYVAELRQLGLTVDVIGRCAESSKPLQNDDSSIQIPEACSRSSYYSKDTSECLNFLQQTYRFYFSFENSLCRDYVTEKFYRAASLDMIPVVLNGANMSQFAPPHSYIDAADFASPSQLAEYLLKVASDEQLFSTYFWWKARYDVADSWGDKAFVQHFCNLCTRLHEFSEDQTKNIINSSSSSSSQKDTKTTMIYSDIEKWWMIDGNCIEGQYDFKSPQVVRFSNTTETIKR